MDDFDIKQTSGSSGTEPPEPIKPAAPSIDKLLSLVKGEFDRMKQPPHFSSHERSAQRLRDGADIGVVAQATLIGEPFAFEDFKEKLGIAQKGARELAVLETGLSNAKLLDKESVHVIREGVIEAGPHEHEALEKLNDFRESWHEVGRELMQMGSSIPNPDLRKQLLAQINDIYRNDKHPPFKG